MRRGDKWNRVYISAPLSPRRMNGVHNKKQK